MKTIKTTLFFNLFLSLFFYSQLSYGLIRYSGGGNGSYQMNLAASHPMVDANPILGSNGEKYYFVHPQNSLMGFRVDGSTSQASGMVTCREHYILGSGYLSAVYAYHQVFAYMPIASFRIHGYETYKINSNTFFTLYSDNGITDGWRKITGSSCSNMGGEYVSANGFNVQFPFFINIYVKDLPIDGKVVIPQTTIAGYTRMFQDVGKPTMMVPADKSMIKLILNTTVISYPSRCQSSIDNLNINHQTLDSTVFDNKQIRTVTYQCDRDESAKIKLTLDYAIDGDPQKRVPLTSGNNTIYSELTLIEDGQNRGKSFETTINKVKNIQIESHIQGLDAEPGKYSGNAWIIATFI